MSRLHPNGFSLIEILIILFILGVIGGIGSFNYIQIRQAQAARSGISSVSLIMAKAATMASSRGVPLSLVRSGNVLEVRTQDPTPQVLMQETLPADIASQLPSTDPWVSFTSAGRVSMASLSNNPFSISTRGKTYTLTISLIGEVKVVAP